jgi:uncharacterized membrane protein YqiK
MFGAVLVLVGVLLGVLSVFGSAMFPVWSDLNGIVTGLLALVFLGLGLMLVAFARFYVRPSANLSFVRTGLGGRRVLIDKGGFYLPVVQQLVPVSLETMKLEVERKGADALITRDNLRVDVKAEFYIKVLPDEDAVINASRSLGEKSVTPEAVSKLVFEKLVSALRSVAATKDLIELHSQRGDFANSVQQLVRTDLEQNGLTLESVTISRLDQTSQDLLSDTNIFDAQGKRKITEITQSALVERNRLEQEARREITIKNVQTGREILELERSRAEAEAAQGALVAKIKAEKNREAETYRLEQERQVKEAEISQQQAVQTAAIERDRQVLLTEQARQTTDVERQKAVELAERERQIAITDAERRRAEAEKQSLEVQAEREKANQSVITVQQVAAAEREAQTKLISAKQSIEQDRFRQQTDAEVRAFSEIKKAEASKQSATLEAQATLQRAQAEAQAREQVAKGETAFKRVDVDIAREQVEVEKARVEVERQALENRQTYAQASIQFEIEKLKVEAQRDVQIEMARSVGTMMGKGQMNIYGDPETLSKMNQQFLRGMGFGTMVDGALNSLGLEGKDVPVALLSLLEQFGFKRNAPEQPTVETKAKETPKPSSSATPGDD